MKEEIDSLNKPAGLLFGKREAHKDEFGLIIQKHSAKLYTGKRIKVSLCLKTEQASRCKVWLQVNDLYDDVITLAYMKTKLRKQRIGVLIHLLPMYLMSVHRSCWVFNLSVEEKFG